MMHRCKVLVVVLLGLLYGRAVDVTVVQAALKNELGEQLILQKTTLSAGAAWLNPPMKQIPPDATTNNIFSAKSSQVPSAGTVVYGIQSFSRMSVTLFWNTTNQGSYHCLVQPSPFIGGVSFVNKESNGTVIFHAWIHQMCAEADCSK